MNKVNKEYHYNMYNVNILQTVNFSEDERIPEIFLQNENNLLFFFIRQNCIFSIRKY